MLITNLIQNKILKTSSIVEFTHAKLLNKESASDKLHCSTMSFPIQIIQTVHTHIYVVKLFLDEDMRKAQGQLNSRSKN